MQAVRVNLQRAEASVFCVEIGAVKNVWLPKTEVLPVGDEYVIIPTRITPDGSMCVIEVRGRYYQVPASHLRQLAGVSACGYVAANLLGGQFAN